MIKNNERINSIEEYKPSKRTSDGDVKKLDWNECNLPFDKNYKEILDSSLLSINYSEYPNINNENLIKKLSDYCAVTSENIQTFNGSDSALHYIFACFLNEKTKILIFYPNYNQIETYIKLYTDNIFYSQIIEPFGEHRYNFEDIKNNDVIYLSNPNNPTGYCLGIGVIENLLRDNPEKLFIIDEAYFEFSKLSCSSLVMKFENVVVTRTFSKAFSLASIRLGYICAHEKIIQIINKIRNTKEVNSFAQKLGEVALNNFHYVEKRIDTIIKNRKNFEEILINNNVEFIKSQSNFVLVRLKNSCDVISNLLSEKILVRDRGMFRGLENSIRITIGEWKDMETIIEIILKTNEHR